jgi:hypothetical protein
LRVYAIKDQGRALEFMHKVSRACPLSWRPWHHDWDLVGATPSDFVQTKTDDIPMCIAGFQGYMLAGIGRSLRLYEMGKKALLRKCENSVSPRRLRLQPLILTPRRVSLHALLRSTSSGRGSLSATCKSRPSTASIDPSRPVNCSSSPTTRSLAG